MAIGVVMAAPAVATTHDDGRYPGTGGSPAPTDRLAHSAAQLREIRDRQHALVAGHRHAPTFAKAAAVVLTVDTTEDSDLATPDGTACVDAASGKCSLRAAVSAADNLGRPTQITLAADTYTLSLGTSLTVANPAGTSIAGQGGAATTIAGAGSRIITVTGSTQAGLLFLTSLTLTGGSAPSGGALTLDETTIGTTAVLDDVVVSGNTATVDGGGIELQNAGTLYAHDSRIVHNTAPNGAGIYTFASDVHLTQTRINANRSPSGTTGVGGGISSEYSVISMTRGSIAHNAVGDAADTGYGAAILDEYGNVALDRVRIDHNVARSGGQGGALYTYSDLVDVNDGSVSDNHASGTASSGGAVYADDGSMLGVHGVTMTGNTVSAEPEAPYGGGAVYGSPTGSPTSITIDSGTVIEGSNAGAVYGALGGSLDVTIAGSTLRDNHNAAANGSYSAACGGAVCLFGMADGGGRLTMTGNTVTGNTSTGGGGGGGAVAVDSQYIGSMSVVLRRNEFRGNRAGAGGYGGAVFLGNEGDEAPFTARLAHNRFIDNRAGSMSDSGAGGGLALYQFVSLIDTGSVFSGNRAIGSAASGGGIDDEGFESTKLTGTVMTRNSAGLGTDDGIGGGLYTDSTSGVSLDRVTLADNRAASHGGGMYLGASAYAVSVRRSTLSGNVAGSAGVAGLGGGVYQRESVLTLENSTIAGNKAVSTVLADGYGGGVYAVQGRTALRYSTVSRNIAKQGGGLYIESIGGTLLGSIVTGNHAGAGGPEDDCVAASPTAALRTLGGNLVGQRACATAISSTDKLTKTPWLRKLADNGGPTQTMALTAKSAAVGRGTFQCPVADQRGHSRPSKQCDAGAYELPRVKPHHRRA
jgi:hypothetical protein